MKKILLLLFPIFVTLLCAAQSSVTHIYEYDIAGNRILRTIITLRKAVSSNEDTLSSAIPDFTEDVHYLETIGQNQVTVYPNPTKGLVTLQFENPIKGFFHLKDLSGKIISEGSISSETTSFNLSQYRNGMYLLILTIEGKTETWKIIKQ